MDLQSLYPASLTPSFLTAIKNSHIANYNDLFFVSPPIYFNLFVWLECLIHLPVSFWAIGGLLRGMFLFFCFCVCFALGGCDERVWWEGRKREKGKEKVLMLKTNLLLCVMMSIYISV